MSKTIEGAAVITGRNGILVPEFGVLQDDIKADMPIKFRQFFDRLFELNRELVAPNDDFYVYPVNGGRLVLPPTKSNPLTLLTHHPLSVYRRPGSYTIATPPAEVGDFIPQMKLKFDIPYHRNRKALEIELGIKDSDEFTKRDWSYYMHEGSPESYEREFHFSQSDIQFLGAAAVKLESLLSE